MKKTLSFALALASILACFALVMPAAAQTTLTQTTLSSAVSTTAQNLIAVASASGITATSSFIFVDKELMAVNAVNGTQLSVTRGYNGTLAQTHNSGATVYAGNAPLFYNVDPQGACVAGNQTVPVISQFTGREWNCINSTWMVDTGLLSLPPGACNGFVSGNAGTTGLIANGASATFAAPMVQTAVTSTGTNTLGLACNLDALSALARSGVQMVTLIDATLYYGVQTSALGTQAAVLASGTMNGSLVFSKIAFPAAAASETASTVAPVRADSGTLTITPVVASFNTATTTAGAFYSVKFTPASGIPIATDLTKYFLTANFQASATSATVVNSPGVLIHYAYLPD
jgi:hypothetical protein